MNNIQAIYINDSKQEVMETQTRSYETGSDSGIEDPLQAEERDTIQHNLIRTTSPKHRILSNWDSRFPKRLFETSQFGLGHYGRPQHRRMSDPGRLSLSPVRVRTTHVRHGLSELSLEEESETEYDDGNDSLDHPRLNDLRNSSVSVDDCYISPRSLSPGRSRSRERYWKRRTQRSYSLPSSDPWAFESGEAIGALALATPFEAWDYCGRRRSVSMEPSYLEAIAEEGGNYRNTCGRRHSTTNI